MIAPSSEAVAVSVTRPLTVAPSPGSVMATLGGASLLLTVTPMVAVVRLPAASVISALRPWAPSPSPVVSQLAVNRSPAPL
jgi:hypothetical protein